MRLVTYLDDKQQFFACYAASLAARLVQRASFSPSLEALSLALLREDAPYELASKLRRMLADASLSAELTDAFRHGGGFIGGLLGGGRPSDIELNALVLTAGAWPSSMPSPSGTAEEEIAHCLPPALAAMCGTFETFYTRSHSSRQLAWVRAKLLGLALNPP